jgi:hypothetical protein
MVPCEVEDGVSRLEGEQLNCQLLVFKRYLGHLAHFLALTCVPRRPCSKLVLLDATDKVRSRLVIYLSRVNDPLKKFHVADIQVLSLQVVFVSLNLLVVEDRMIDCLIVGVPKCA